MSEKSKEWVISEGFSNREDRPGIYSRDYIVDTIKPLENSLLEAEKYIAGTNEGDVRNLRELEDKLDLAFESLVGISSTLLTNISVSAIPSLFLAKEMGNHVSTMIQYFQIKATFLARQKKMTLSEQYKQIAKAISGI